MKVLLDTHVFLWWVLASPRLSVRARRVMSASSNEIFFSSVSAWEIAIKTALGQLNLGSRNLEQFIAQQIEVNTFSILPIELSHALKIFALPNHHKDPFDRMLIAQATVEDMVLLSADSVLRQYQISVLW